MIWGYEYWFIIPDSLPLGLEMVYEWVLDGLRDSLGVGLGRLMWFQSFELVNKHDLRIWVLVDYSQV